MMKNYLLCTLLLVASSAIVGSDDPYAALPPILRQICKQTLADDYAPCQQIFDLMAPESEYQKILQSAQKRMNEFPCNHAYASIGSGCESAKFFVNVKTRQERAFAIEKPIKDLAQQHQLFPATVDTAVNHCQKKIKGEAASSDPLLEEDIGFVRQKELHDTAKQDLKVQRLSKLKTVLPDVMYAYCVDHYGECEKLARGIEAKSTAPAIRDSVVELACKLELSPATVSNILKNCDPHITNNPVAIAVDMNHEKAEIDELIATFPQDIEIEGSKKYRSVRSACKAAQHSSKGLWGSCYYLMQVAYCLQKRGQKDPLCSESLLLRGAIDDRLGDLRHRIGDNPYCIHSSKEFVESVYANMQRKTTANPVQPMQVAQPVEQKIVLEIAPQIKPSELSQECPGCEIAQGQSSWWPWGKKKSNN
jgi:hypothetical protein